MPKPSWVYQGDGQITDADGKAVFYVSAFRQDDDDVEGRIGNAARIGYLAAAAPALYEALKTSRQKVFNAALAAGNSEETALAACADADAALAAALPPEDRT